MKRLCEGVMEIVADSRDAEYGYIYVSVGE
jgi:hypothetical protein